MKLNKKVVEGVAVLGLFGILAITAVTSSEMADKADKTKKTSSAQETTVSTNSLENDGLAGASATLLDYQKGEYAEADDKIGVTEESHDVVASGQDAQKDNVQTEEKKEPELTPEQKEWQDKLMAKVSESLNVRKKASEESDIVGKLYKGDRALVVKAGKTWTLIESGHVKGYVKNEFCVTGDEALAYAKKTVPTVAKAKIDGLRVRKKPSTEAGVVVALEAGKKLKLDKKAKKVDGWVAVKYESKTCYVSAEYVEIRLDTGKAITIEEEKAKKEAAANGSQTKNGSSVSASASDIELLAAIIMCEAGAESYESQLAVGAVVCNRVKSSRYPNTIRGVIYQSGQFTPASSGTLERVLRKNLASNTARRAARAALSGQDNTQGAIGFRHYHKGLKGVRVGCMLFFKR